MNIRNESTCLIVLAVVCVVVFANSLGGEFVYDDVRQIVRNTMIQDNSMIWKALSSDVWAFKGDGTVAASNYWRPTFTLWNIICFRLFGINPVGWHVANLVLHAGVTILAFLLLRRWNYTAMIAFTIALIFAVHPVHVESVAWIAGSPDLLFSLAFLASLWFATSYRDSQRSLDLILTILFYAISLGAKEIGILCLPIYYFVIAGSNEEKSKKRFDSTPLILLGVTAAGYFIIRWLVLGAVSRPPQDAVALGDALLSVPSMFAFYLRQLFAPLSIAANYPLIPASQLTATNFFLPLAISLAALAGIGYLARTASRARLAAAIFLLPLIPAMNATAFISDQLVHDRYLYLPLLGMLMLLVPFAAKFASERNLMIAGCVVALALGIQTLRYNTAWANALSLWTWTATVDDSSFTSVQLGSALAAADRNEEAIKAFSAALTKQPTFRAYLGRGRAYVATKKYSAAEADLSSAFQMPAESQEIYALYQAYEAMAIASTEQQKFEEAISSLRDARLKLPIYAASLTEKLAVALYQSGQKAEALKELEASQTQARRELLPESKSVFFRLALLYVEFGKTNEARAALNEYLRLTASAADKTSLANRREATKLLATLK